MKKRKIKIIKNKKGNIVKFYNFKKPLLNRYGEIYFSEVKKGVFKGWKFHENINQVMTICSGIVEFSFKKKINSKIKKITLSYPDKLGILYIPKNTHYCFRCKSQKKAMIVNLIDNLIS
jgi:hypothetical protein